MNAPPSDTIPDLDSIVSQFDQDIRAHEQELHQIIADYRLALEDYSLNEVRTDLNAIPGSHARKP